MRATHGGWRDLVREAAVTIHDAGTDARWMAAHCGADADTVDRLQGQAEAAIEAGDRLARAMAELDADPATPRDREVRRCELCRMPIPDLLADDRCPLCPGDEIPLGHAALHRVDVDPAE